MAKIELTSHAKERMQQRAISELQIRLINEFGQREYQKGGSELGFIPQKMLAELRRAIDNLGKVAVVFGESDRVITALHQHRRGTSTRRAA